MRKTRNTSNAVVATSDARESRRRERRAPTTHKREEHASDLRRRRDDERSERRSTGPEAQTGTRETRNASNAVVATSEVREGRRCGRRAPTTRFARDAGVWDAATTTSDAAKTDGAGGPCQDGIPMAPEAHAGWERARHETQATRGNKRRVGKSTAREANAAITRARVICNAVM